MPIASRVIGCSSCGKPAALVGDELEPNMRCLWCIAEARPHAASLFLTENCPMCDTTVEEYFAARGEDLATIAAETRAVLLKAVDEFKKQQDSGKTESPDP